MNLKNVRFTVLLPVLDREDISNGLPSAVESIFNNSLKPDQVIVTVDGPTSYKFKKLLEFYENKYSLDLVWINKKVGLDKALNIGLSKCKNEIVFFLESLFLNA